MSDKLNIIDFLSPVNRFVLSGDEGYKDGQIGKTISLYEEQLPDLDEADIVFVGCDEERGRDLSTINSNAPDAIREQFYRLYSWHADLKLADIGNVKNGAALTDTYAALKNCGW